MDTTTTTPRLIPLADVQAGDTIAAAYTGHEWADWVTATGPAESTGPLRVDSAILVPVTLRDGTPSTMVGDRTITRVWVR